jgi:hypothetical protein
MIEEMIEMIDQGRSKGERTEFLYPRDILLLEMFHSPLLPSS